MNLQNDYMIPARHFWVRSFRNSGWIGTIELGFSFEDGFSRPGAGCKAFIRRASGRPLHQDEFDFRFGNTASDSATDTLQPEIRPR